MTDIFISVYFEKCGVKIAVVAMQNCLGCAPEILEENGATPDMVEENGALTGFVEENDATPAVCRLSHQVLW